MPAALSGNIFGALLEAYVRILKRIVTLLLLLPSLHAFGANGFDEQFNGTSLDLTKWMILDGSPGVSVDNGTLILRGSPDHKRVNSIAQFAPPAGGAVTVSARVYVGQGDYQKFGFNVNAIEFAAPTAGFYFDTLEVPDTVTAIVWLVPGEPVVQQLSLPWDSWYEFAVRWTGTDVTFFIDGVARAQVPFVWTSALPVGAWNDRPGTMYVDWLMVDTVTFDQDGDGIPDAGDTCADSDLAPTVVIGTCDSGAPNVIYPDGCTLADKVNACLAAASNHGQFVSCVVHVTSDERVRRCAARSRLP